MYLLYIFKYIKIKILFDKFVLFFKSEFTLFYRWQSQHLSVSYPHLDIKENICDAKNCMLHSLQDSNLHSSCYSSPVNVMMCSIYGKMEVL